MNSRTTALIFTKPAQLSLIALAQLLAMSLWFSASAVAPQLQLHWSLTTIEAGWLTASVQLGFVFGALFSALGNLSDRIDVQRLFVICSLFGATSTASIALLDMPFSAALALRFATGMVLAGMYPPGMKLITSWCTTDRGLGIGILVGALTIGTALPHFLNALNDSGSGGIPPWRTVLLTAAALAVFAAMITMFWVRNGPNISPSAPFNPRFALNALRDRPTRLANFGYLGHMWELYAMWAWAPVMLIASYQQAGLDPNHARLAGFSIIAIGAIGSVLAGLLADRLGRTTVTIASLIVSGSCAALAGLLFDEPLWLTAICLVWGFAVVADSAQFSAAVSELTDPRYVGSALTMQTSLGFLLTLVTIELIPALLDSMGWRWVFMVLAIGPIFGGISMWQLRGLPEARKMASGHR